MTETTRRMTGSNNNGKELCDSLWRSITRLSLNTGGRAKAWPLERKKMKKETLEKITTWLCWSIFMAGLGYAWAYHHWMAWAAEQGLSL